MFIIERRTAGVLAALATTVAIVVIGTARESVDVVETSTTVNSTPALATSVAPGVTPIAVATNEAQTPRH